MLVVLDSVADAFMSVSVLVAALFVLFGLARVRWGSRFESLLVGRQRTGPLLAVAATLPPGCIGVLAISRLYVQGAVSYGTVIAALVSTMGDAAWLLLAEEPLLTLGLKAGFAVLGCLAGLAVDLLGLRPKESAATAGRSLVAVASGSSQPATGLTDDAPAAAPHHAEDTCHIPTEPRHVAAQPLTFLFLACLAVGLLVSLPVTLRIVPEEAIEGAAHVLGLLGTAAAIAIVLASRGRLACGEEDNEVEHTTSEVLQNCAREAAFVTVWVSGVFLAWELAEAYTPIGDGQLPLGGMLGIGLAATAGLIPACGVEILVSALFVSGALPAPTLITYLISQDGNGFIPIAARRPRAAVHGMVLTTLLALAVGLLVLLVQRW
jgi:hypothetical protein